MTYLDAVRLEGSAMALNDAAQGAGSGGGDRALLDKEDA